MNQTMRAMVVALAVISIAGWAVAQSSQPQTYPSEPQHQPMAPSGQAPTSSMGQGSQMGHMGQTGQMGQAGQMGQTGQMGQYYAQLEPANNIIGKEVRNNQGQNLGTLKDIVLEPNLNYVAYGVLAKGGFLGVGENYYAIPWDTFQLSPDKNQLILNIPAQAFDQAQGFNKNNWPDRADQRWRMQAMSGQSGGQQYGGASSTPYSAPSGAQGSEQYGAEQNQQWRDQQWREQQQWRQQGAQQGAQQGTQPQAMNQQSRQSSQVYGRPLPQSDQPWAAQQPSAVQQPPAVQQPSAVQQPPAVQQPSAVQQPPAQSGQTYSATRPGAAAARGYGRGSESGFDARRVSQLLGMNVQTYANQQKVGDLNDLVLDFQQGLVAYGVVSLEGSKKAAVPWSAIEIRPMDKVALVDADIQTLDQVAFSGKELPDLGNPQYAWNIHNTFNREPYWEVLGFVGSSGQARQGAQPRAMQQRQQPMQQPMSQQPMSQQPVQQPMSQPQSMQGQDAQQYFNPQNISVISGTIEGTGTFQPQQEGISGQRLRVRTQDGQTIIVNSAPSQFLQQQGLTLQRGEQVQLRGSFANINGRSIFIASDIRTQNAEVQLRDQQGRPMWSGADMQQSQQQQ